MKRFMYLSISILCLSIAALIGFYIGSERAQAQVPGPIVGYTGISAHFAMLSNGDVYFNWPSGPSVNGQNTFNVPAVYIGNFWTGEMAPVPTSPDTWGGVKGKYEGNK